MYGRCTNGNDTSEIPALLHGQRLTVTGIIEMAEVAERPSIYGCRWLCIFISEIPTSVTSLSALSGKRAVVIPITDRCSTNAGWNHK